MPKYNLTRSVKAGTYKMLAELFGCDEADLTSDIQLYVPKRSMAPKPCACGCLDENGEPRLTNSTWVTGHDGIVKKHLIAVIRGNRAAKAGWWDELTPEGALYILQTAGWDKGVNLD